MSTTLDQFDITGRSAFIAGTASGIGLAYAEAMAEAGAKVTLSDIDVEEAEREAARLCSEGGEVRAAKVNVSDLDQVAAACDDHVSSYGGVDIVFANAGYYAGNGFWNPGGGRNPKGQIDVYDPAAWSRSIEVKLTGIFSTIREAVRCMKAGGRQGVDHRHRFQRGVEQRSDCRRSLYARKSRSSPFGAPYSVGAC